MGMYTTIIGKFESDLTEEEIYQRIKKYVDSKKTTRMDGLLNLDEKKLNKYSGTHLGYNEHLFSLHIKQYGDSNEEIIDLFEKMHDGLSDGFITFLSEYNPTHTIHIINGSHVEHGF